jgi:spermidine synthase
MSPRTMPDKPASAARATEDKEILRRAWARCQNWKPRQEEIVFTGKTKFQNVRIERIEGYGLNLYLDDQWQSGEVDEFIYHEMLVHPAMFCQKNPVDVLVIGGAEGATAREVLRHRSVRHLTQVDIDGELIEICKRYLPSMNSGSYDDPRMQTVIGDGADFLESTDKSFDVIIVDLPDWAPDTPAEALYSVMFYQLLAKRLNRAGIVSLHIGPFQPARIEALLVTARMVRSVFGSIVIFPAVERRWGFALGSMERITKNPGFRQQELLSELAYYNEELHAHLGALPNYIKSKLRGDALKS